MSTDLHFTHRFNFTAALVLFFGLIFGVLFSLGIAFLWQYYTGVPLEKVNENVLFTMLSYLFVMLFPILAYDLFMVRAKKQVLNFNMQSKSIWVYLMIFPMMFGMMLMVEYFTDLIPTEGGFWGELYDEFSRTFINLSEDEAGLLILTVLFAPLLEEILFRGIIQKGMINNGVKPVTAIVLASLFFGLFHMNPWQLVGAFLLGLVLGLVYYKTQSLLMPILLHAFNNFISSYMLIDGSAESFADLFQWKGEWVLLLGMGIFSLFCILFFIYYKKRKI